MSREQLAKYFVDIDFNVDIDMQLSPMHPDDLYLVLDTLLPEGTDVKFAVKEVLEWKQLN
jgi:hypothetical protein